MSSAHAGAAGRSSNNNNAAAAEPVASSSQQGGASARNRKRKNPPASNNSMNNAKGNRLPPPGGPHPPFQQHPGNFLPGGPRGPGFPGQMPPPGMPPHMMPSTGMGFGFAEEEDPIDYIIDDTSRLTSRDIAMARYKRNHELLNMVFDARRIDSLVPPPSPYESMDKTALQEQIANLRQETSDLKRKNDEKIAQWQQEALEHEDLLHAPPKRLKQQREEQDAINRAEFRGEDVNGIKDTETPIWARAPFKGRILGVGYVRAVTPDEVRAQLPPSPPSHSPSPPPRPQQVTQAATPQQQSSQPQQQGGAPQQGSAVPAPVQPAAQPVKEEAAPQTTVKEEQPAQSLAAPIAATADNLPTQGLESATEKAVALNDSVKEGGQGVADDQGDGNDDDAEGEENDDDADADADDDGEDADDDANKDEHADNAAHDEGGIHNEYGNAKEEDHMIAMGITDPDPMQEDGDMNNFVASAAEDAMQVPAAAEAGQEDGTAAVVAATGGDESGEPADVKESELPQLNDAPALQADTSMQDATDAPGPQVVPAEEAGAAAALDTEDKTVPAPITEATVPIGSGATE